MKKTDFIYLVMLLSVIISSCNDDTAAPANADNSPKLRALSVSEQKIVNSTNDFAFNLLRQVNEEDREKNLFISPLSVGTALAMTYNGAAGNTKEQIQKVLGFEGLEAQELNTAFKDLQNLLLNIDKKTQFNIANSIWYRNTLTLRGGFNSLIKENYDGEIEPLDFKDPNAKNTINQWVEAKTQNKIKELVKEVTPDHVMFLINAIYFKSTWTYRFDKSATKPMDFHKADGSVVSRKMMFSDKLKFLYSHNDQVQFIDLPYGNQQFYMSILLPREGNSINDVINGLDADKLKRLVQQADTSGVHLYLPKFKLEYEIKLNETLKTLGIEEAFTNNANFSNFFNNPESLAISEVNHKTFIEVDEDGTEAAAATSVGIVVTSMPATPPAIHINRPFIFFIREKSTENILFAGKILDPEV